MLFVCIDANNLYMQNC